MQKIKRYLSLKNIRAVVAMVAIAILFAGTYFFIQSNWGKDEQNPYIFSVLLIDLLLFSVAMLFLFKKIFFRRMNPERKLYGSRLHKRILLIFSLLSGIPTLVLAIVASVFLYYIVDSWFDKKITTVLEESVLVAESYLKENREMIKMKAKSIANGLDDNIMKHDLASKPRLLFDVVNSFIELNNMSEAVVFYGHVPVIRSRFGISLSLERIPEEYYRKAAQGKVVVFKKLNRMRAIAALHSIPNSFLVVGKQIDNTVTKHIQKSQNAAAKYRSIKNNIEELQLKSAIAFLTTSAVLLLIAGSIGLAFSRAILDPIIKLVLATEKVKDGKFTVKLPEGPENDEIANLSRAFNLMTKRISEQQGKLIQAYNEIDQKRKFVEMVLSGVSTGIIALDPDHKVQLINKSGIKLLGLENSNLKNLDLSHILPESLELINKISSSQITEISGEIKSRAKGRALTLLVKIAKDIDKHNNVVSYTIAFDDMTQIIQAQRYKAWSDIARRIAHEVKNPLTPIYLGAERIKQKYSKQITDKKDFNMYVDTIIRHAQDIGGIIEEFSKFARMPAPVFEKVDLSKLVTDIIFSRKIVGKDIKFKTEIGKNVIGCFDSTQIRQLLTNVIKNSEEAVRLITDDKKRKFIKVSLHKKHNTASIIVEDGGKGFDKESVNKVIEPYFTTKTKGTGLGLAIVKKIVDDHEGEFIIRNGVYNNNAVVEIILPTNLKSQNTLVHLESKEN